MMEERAESRKKAGAVWKVVFAFRVYTQTAQSSVEMRQGWKATRKAREVVVVSV